MKYHNPYARIQVYHSWLINNKFYTPLDEVYDYGISLARLAEITSIPINVIRQDFVCMLQWQNSISLTLNKLSKKSSDTADFTRNTVISFPEDDEVYRSLKDTYHLEELYEQLMSDEFPTEFEELLLKGLLDTVPFYIDKDITNATYQLSLSQEEYAALGAFNENSLVLQKSIQKLKHSYTNSYHIKDSYLFTHQYMDLNKKLDCLNNAIENGNCLDIKYRTSKGKIISFLFMPLKIVYDADENLYSVLSIYENSVRIHRLDHILSLKESNKKIEKPNEDLLNIYPNVWGNCFSDMPEYVKVRFYNEGNVWDKVKKELATRTNGKLYEKDGFLYYEDMVYGINKFRSWIYGYGSSAIVLEPESLQKHILDSLNVRKTGEGSDFKFV